MEINKIEELSSWYTDEFLEFDIKLQLLRLDSIKKYFRGTTCLEIAPAQGIHTKHLVNIFESVDLIDGSQNLLDLIPNYSNCRKYHSLIEDFEPNQLYDTIIMDHLLEHLENPVKGLSRIKNWLKDDGVLIVGVPNAKSFHRLLGVKMGLLDSIYSFNERDVKLGHFRIYDLDTLQTDAKLAGLNVINTDGVFFKILSNSQLNSYEEKTIIGFYQLGKEFKENCAEIYIICQK